MVTFQTDDWKFTQLKCEEYLVKYRQLLEQPNNTFREKLIAIGQILALKTILNLPQDVALAAKGNK